MVKAKEFKIHHNIGLLIQSDEPLNLSHGIEFVSSVKCGAINTFSGTIRDLDLDESINQLVPIKAILYESHTSMASKQISKIVNETINPELTPNASDTDEPGATPPYDPNARAYVAIRLGTVPVGEASIIICVSSTGRDVSHQAVMRILKEIKSSVVIWKKIVFDDGREKWMDDGRSEAFWVSDERKL